MNLENEQPKTSNRVRTCVGYAACLTFVVALAIFNVAAKREDELVGRQLNIIRQNVARCRDKIAEFKEVESTVADSLDYENLIHNRVLDAIQDFIDDPEAMKMMNDRWYSACRYQGATPSLGAGFRVDYFLPEGDYTFHVLYGKTDFSTTNPPVEESHSIPFKSDGKHVQIDIVRADDIAESSIKISCSEFETIQFSLPPEFDKIGSWSRIGGTDRAMGLVNQVEWVTLEGPQIFQSVNRWDIGLGGRADGMRASIRIIVESNEPYWASPSHVAQHPMMFQTKLKNETPNGVFVPGKKAGRFIFCPKIQRRFREQLRKAVQMKQDDG